jgi:Ca-activated chloride channel family protein
VRQWEDKYHTNPILKGQDLALTPMVFVMWKSRYEAFIQRAPGVSMKMLYYAMRAPTGWGAIADMPEWGHFKFGHTRPNQSNSGLMTLIVLAYAYYEKRAGLTVLHVTWPEFQTYLARVEHRVALLSNSTGNLMREMVFKGPVGCDALMVYESLAIDYLEKARSRWEPLQVIYPEYNLWNNNPYFILNVPWSSQEHRDAAEAFLDFLMSEPIQARALDHGFRPANLDVPVRGPESPFTRFAEYGLSVEVPPVCEVPSREVIENLQESWVRHAVPH